jgi:hypothetical protein
MMIQLASDLELGQVVIEIAQTNWSKLELELQESIQKIQTYL